MSRSNPRGRRLALALAVVAIAITVVLSGVGTVQGGAGHSPSAPGEIISSPSPSVTLPSAPLASASPLAAMGHGTPEILPLSSPVAGATSPAPSSTVGNTPISPVLFGRGSAGAPGPADLANPALADVSVGASVAAVGPGNGSLVVGLNDETYYVEGSGLIFTYGFSAAVRTDDGGAAWSTSWIGLNASWTTTGNPALGSVTWGASSVAGGNGTAFYATTYSQSCIVLGTTCNSTLGIAAPSGVAVARSTTGGASWDPPQPIDSVAEYRFVSGSCGGTAYSGYVQGNYSDKPSVAYSTDGRVAVVAWDVLGYYDSVICVGTTAEESVSDITDIAQVSVSRNGGATWSAPRTLGAGVSGPAAVAIGPSPADDLSFVYQDSANGTEFTFPYALSVSTNLGASWSAPQDLGSATMVHPVTSTAPDAWAVASLPDLAADANASSPFAGTFYLTWNDNRTSAAVGDPSVAIVSGTVHGGWSGVEYLTPAGGDYRYFQPSVAVDPSGRVWVVYYAENRSNGDYQLVGQYSVTGGLSWTAPFAVADATSAPSAAVTNIGYWVGAAATASGLYAAWTDCRTSECSVDDSPSVDAANAAPVTITASVGGVTATVSSSGWSFSSVAPVATAWVLNAAVTISVPPWVLLSNTTQNVGVFEEFIGALSSSTSPVTIDYSGGAVVSAIYTLTAAGWVAGTVGPANGNPTVTVGGVAAPLGPVNGGVQSFNISVEPGLVYTVGASARDYAPFSQLVPTAIAETTTLTILLQREAGWIVGRLTPATATLTVNGTVVPSVDPTSGLYNVSAGWGAYWVNATSAGLTSFSEYVTVQTGHATQVSPTLVGSWIAGTIVPGSAALTIDGTAVLVGVGGFNVSLGGGTHSINATDAGYAPYHATVVVAPGQGIFVRIVLTDIGAVRGTVSPITASVLILGGPVPVIGGAYDDALSGGATYNVSAQAPGFATAWTLVTITPAVTSFANFSLVRLATCTSGCGTTNGTTHSASGTAAFSYLDAAIAAAAILAIGVVVAAVILYSGRRPPAGGAPAGEEIYGVPGSDVPNADVEPPPPPGDVAP